MKPVKVLLLLIVLLNFTTLFGVKELLNYDRLTLYYDKADLPLAEMIGEQLPLIIDNFQQTIGVYPEFKAKIYLSHDREDFQSRVDLFGGITEFSNAFYSKRDNYIYIKSYFEIGDRDTFLRILLHEYIHAFIDYHFKDAPLWFHEGMAIYFAQQYSTQMTVNLGMDYLAGNVKELAQMEDYYPMQSHNLSSFYAKSALAVKMLHQKDSGAFSTLFVSVKRFDSAFFRSYKKSKTKFYSEFEKKFKAKMYFSVVYALFTFVWILLPILMFFGWIKQSRKREEQIEAMESDEENEGVRLV